MVFTDEAGEGLSLIVWFLFGAAMVVPAFEKVTWQDFAFAVAALTVVRMLPVALALIGSGLDRRTVAFVGWFGPRGLASVVFALLAYDALEPADANRVLAAVTVTVLLSVLAHGLSASPLTKRYAASVNKLHPAKPEHQPAGELRTRSFSGHRQRSVVTTPGQ
jgi:NhaP-type Na+/H+ or K+/H+ antiporter